MELVGNTVYIFVFATVPFQNNNAISINEPRRQKTGLRGFRPGPTQTGLYNHKIELEAWDFVFRKKRDCTIRLAKTKALIRSWSASMFFALAKIRFSHVAAQIIKDYEIIWIRCAEGRQKMKINSTNFAFRSFLYCYAIGTVYTKNLSRLSLVSDFSDYYQLPCVYILILILPWCRNQD